MDIETQDLILKKTQNRTYWVNFRKIANDPKADKDKQFMYKGLKLFNENDTGSYGIYRCVHNVYGKGNPFSILVEGI